MSVAESVTVRGHNPREGIHQSSHISRICTYYICVVLQERRAICGGERHRIFDGANEKCGLIGVRNL